MFAYILTIIGVLIYVVLPMPLQLVVLILNTAIVDPIPYVDEIIMYASFIKKLARYGRMIEWAEEHKTLLTVIGVGIVVVILIILFYHLFH